VILAGDVGGTKTALALFDDRGDGGLVIAREATLPSQEFAGLDAVVARLLAAGPAVEIEAACFGVPGPVVDGRATAVNLPWEIEESRLAATIGARRVKLLNDLEAAAYGVLGLPATDLVPLQPGRPRAGHRALIAAGTGLGEAALFWDGTQHHAMASEGGHADFAPRTDRELELLRFLAAELGHVSYERALSGPGLVNIYRFVRESAAGAEPAWLAEQLAQGDPAAVVSEAALAGRDPRCVEALDLFVSIYGAEAGNLALRTLAAGGVFVGGGIAPKIRPRLLDGRFIAAFRDKGRLAPLMDTFPVHLVLNERAPLLGAAEMAHRLATRAARPS
jgi:glucokinase